MSAGETSKIVREAGEVVAGCYDMLGRRFDEALIDWHRDPVTGSISPRTCAFQLDYRDSRRVGNAKSIWEKSRHHHLTVLATTYGLTGDTRYVTEIEHQLESWISSNPFPEGINWTSSLELGIRLISWVWIERLIYGTDAHERLFGKRGSLWPAAYWHQWLISKHYSVGSSANNHLVGEMAGLFLAATCWPVFASSASWASKSTAILEREIQRQTFPSGLNRELGFEYHIFSLEFFLLAAVEAERSGKSFSARYLGVLRKQMEILPLLADAAGNLPSFGDEDNGMALQLRPSGSSRTDWIYRIGRHWLGARVPQPAGESGLLMAKLVRPETQDVHIPFEQAAGPTAIPDAGVYQLASQRGTEHEILCTADAGPLGFLSIAAHGHADALSFALNVGGQRVIVDPGTYIYHAEPQRRFYFRSTRAHNTVTIDGADQSVSAGLFMWTKKANTEVLSWKDNTLEAEHDGYTRLPGKPIHRRRIHLDGTILEIVDQVRGGGHHDLEWRLHFHPDCETRLNGNTLDVSFPTGRLHITLDAKLQWAIKRSEQDAGWYSPKFNVKVPADTLVGTVRADLPQNLLNTIEVIHAR